LELRKLRQDSIEHGSRWRHKPICRIHQELERFWIPVFRYSLWQQVRAMNGNDQLESKEPAENGEVYLTAEGIMNVHDVDIMSYQQTVQLVEGMTEIDGKPRH